MESTGSALGAPNPAAVLGFVLGVTELHLAATIGIFLGWEKKDKRANILHKELDFSSSLEYLITPLARQEALSLQLSTGDGLDLLETQQKRDILCLD